MMIIEDYTPVEFDHLPPNAPAEQSEGKFIHIVGPDDEYLVFASYDIVKWHAQILMEFCRRHNDVSCTAYNNGEDARVDRPGWHVQGGGHYRLNRQARKLELGGSSKAYGQFNTVTVPGKIQAVPGWDRYQVVIR